MSAKKTIAQLDTELRKLFTAKKLNLEAIEKATKALKDAKAATKKPVKTKTGKKPKTGKKVNLKQPSIEDIDDEEEPVAPKTGKKTKSIPKSNPTKIEQAIKNNIDKFKLDKKDDQLLRYQLWNNIKLSGINTKKLQKFPKGDTKYWLGIWKTIAPKVKHVKIDELKQELLKIKNKPKTKAIIEKQIKNLSSIKKGTRYNGVVYYTILFIVSEKQHKKDGSISVENKTLNEIKDIVNDIAEDYLEPIQPESYEIVINTGKDIYESDKKKLPTKSNQFDDMPLKHVSFVKLPYDIQANNAIIQNHCVKDHLIENVEKYRLSKQIDFIKNKDVWTVTDLKNLLKTTSKNFIITDQWMKTEWKHTGDKKGSFNRFVCANDHLYYITSSEHSVLKKHYYKSIPVKQIIKIDDSFNPIEDIKTASLESIKIQVKNGTPIINSFVSNDTLFMTGELLDTHALYEKIGVLDQFELTDRFKKYTPFLAIAEKLNLFSTVNQTMSKPKPININYSNNINPKYVHVCDRNKAHTFELMTLPYIPVINSKTMPEDYDAAINIVDEYFYFVSAIGNATVSDFMSVGNYYSGYLVNKFKEQIIITKVLKPTLIENPFKELIQKMLDEESKTNPKTPLTKSVCNEFIGYIQNSYSLKATEKMRCDRLFTSKNECGLTKYITLADDLYLSYEIDTFNKKYSKNMLPLSQYVIDRNIVAVLDRIEHLTNSGLIHKLVSVKTDSIAYTGKACDDLVSNVPGKWKYESYKHRENIISKIDYDDLYNPEYQIPTIRPNLNDPNYMDEYINSNILICRTW